MVTRKFADDAHWRRLASARGVRLPASHVACTTGGMERWLHRLGLGVEWYKQITGYSVLREWITANPGWPLYAFVGLLVEEVATDTECD